MHVYDIWFISQDRVTRFQMHLNLTEIRVISYLCRIGFLKVLLNKKLSNQISFKLCLRTIAKKTGEDIPQSQI